jgi:hypothetical protein
MEPVSETILLNQKHIAYLPDLMDVAYLYPASQQLRFT